MKVLLHAVLMLVLLTTSLFAKQIEGSKDPDKIPDRVALRLLLRSVAFTLEHGDPKVRESLDGFFTLNGFSDGDKALFKQLAVQLHNEELKNEKALIGSTDKKRAELKASRKAFLTTIHDILKDSSGVKKALKDAKRGIVIDESEVND